MPSHTTMATTASTLDELIARMVSLEERVKKANADLKPTRDALKATREAVISAMQARGVDSVMYGAQEVRCVSREVPIKPKIDEQIERATAALHNNAKRARHLVRDLNDPSEVRVATRITRKDASKSSTAGAAKRKAPPAKRKAAAAAPDDGDEEDDEGSGDE